MRRREEDSGDASERVTAVRPLERAPTRDARFSELGEHVASILDAAEQAAERIRSEAQRTADQLVNKAKAVAAARVKEAEAAAQTLRSEAEDEARDTRLAVEAYGSRRRREADEDADRLVADAERRAAAIRDAAESAARELEQSSRARHEQFRERVRLLESRMLQGLEVLRETSSQIESFLAAPPDQQREEPTMADDLSAKRRRLVERGRGRPA